MNKGVLIAGGFAVALALTGCAPQSDQSVAHESCVASAKEQLPKDAEQVNTSKLETTNMSEAIRELAENPLEPDPNDPVLYTTAGDIWYRSAGQDQSQGVICTAEMKDGKPVEPIEAILTDNN